MSGWLFNQATDWLSIVMTSFDSRPSLTHQVPVTKKCARSGFVWRHTVLKRAQCLHKPTFEVVGIQIILPNAPRG